MTLANIATMSVPDLFNLQMNIMKVQEKMYTEPRKPEETLVYAFALEDKRLRDTSTVKSKPELTPGILQMPNICFTMDHVKKY